MPVGAGSRLGPYEIIAPLGAGGLDECIAKAVAALSHPAIVAIHDFAAREGTAYAVTELLTGQTLRERLAAGSLPVRTALDYCVQVAEGLAAAHDKGLVHRDLKPENLFVTTEGRAKILDFGLVRREAAEGDPETVTVSSPTIPGTLLGTVGTCRRSRPPAGLPISARSWAGPWFSSMARFNSRSAAAQTVEELVRSQGVVRLRQALVQSPAPSRRQPSPWQHFSWAPALSRG